MSRDWRSEDQWKQLCAVCIIEVDEEQVCDGAGRVVYEPEGVSESRGDYGCDLLELYGSVGD